MRRLVLLILLAAIPCSAQQPTTGPDNLKSTKADSPSEGITRDQANAILQELKAIRQLLERQASAAGNPQPRAPVKVTMKVEPGSKAVGRDDAPVTIVEFGDYECPFCRIYHGTTFAELKKNYIDTGKVRYVIRDFPLDLHPNALNAALSSRCAGEQNQFWTMRELMLAVSADLSPHSITKFATQLNLDMTKFHACMDDNKYSADVQRDVAAAGSLGINGIPSFIIGKTAKDQIEGVRITGALSFPRVEAAIQNQSQQPALAAGK
jgi:protein-disulfide isomerase